MVVVKQLIIHLILFFVAPSTTKAIWVLILSQATQKLPIAKKLVTTSTI